MTLLNELLQWGVLAFLAVFVVGLTRQLGRSLTPHREQLLEPGPDLGEKLPQVLLGPDRESVEELIAADGSGSAAVAVLAENCPGCRGIVERAEKRRAEPTSGPVIVVARDCSEAFLERLRLCFDSVIADPTGYRTSEAGIAAWPVTFVVDDRLRVVKRDLGLDPADVLAQFREATEDLRLTQHAGRAEAMAVAR